MTLDVDARRVPDGAGSADRVSAWIARHWLFVFNLGMALFVGGTLLAPVLMYAGLEGPARAVYTFYGLNCHQLPERSYFLFGPNGIDSYSLEHVLAWGADPGYLRGFVGNGEVGFKMAMAQRNTAIYSTLLVAGLAYAVVRRRVRPLPARAFALLILPMVLDGFSHVASEVTGLAFRDSNAWLAALTGHALPAAFYTGTTLGSFNWLMRTLTGALFALACAWFAFPRVPRAFSDALHGADGAPARARPRPAAGSWSPHNAGDTERT